VKVNLDNIREDPASYSQKQGIDLYDENLCWVLMKELNITKLRSNYILRQMQKFQGEKSHEQR
jgi:hypothetical protein